MNKKGIQFIITVLFFTFMVAGIHLPAQRIMRAMELPKEYVRASPKTQFSDAFRIDPTRIWKVYSDRQGNFSFTKPYGKLIKAVLPLMDTYFVAEKEGEFLRLMKDTSITELGFFSEEAIDMGWVHYSQLLLSEHCLTSELKLPLKAIISYIPFSEYIDESGAIIRISDTLTAFNDPELRFVGNRILKPHEIYFAYKITAHAILVGMSDRISSESPNLGMAGWIPRSNIVIWNNRIALEPNWEIEASGEIRQMGYKAMLFYDPISASIYSRGYEVASEYILWKCEPGNRRMSGEQLRFPVLAYHNDLVKVGIWGRRPDINPGVLVPVRSRTVPFAAKIDNQPTDFRDFDEAGFTRNLIPFKNLSGHDYFYQEAYTSLTITGFDINLFRTVFLLSRTELAFIVNAYENIINDSRRETVQVKLLDLARIRYDLVKPEVLLDYEMDELLKTIFEVPTKPGYFPGSRLRDLTRPWAIPDPAYKNFIDLMHQKYRDLKTILDSSDYLYSFKSNGVVYYWIDKNQFL